MYKVYNTNANPNCAKSRAVDTGAYDTVTERKFLNFVELHERTKERKRKSMKVLSCGETAPQLNNRPEPTSTRDGTSGMRNCLENSSPDISPRREKTSS